MKITWPNRINGTEVSIVFELKDVPRDGDVTSGIDKQLAALEAAMVLGEPIQAWRAAEQRVKDAETELLAAEDRAYRLLGTDQSTTNGLVHTAGLIERQAAEGKDTSELEKELADLQNALGGIRRRVSGVRTFRDECRAKARTFCMDFIKSRIDPIVRESHTLASHAASDFERDLQASLRSGLARVYSLRSMDERVSKLGTKDGTSEFLKNKFGF